MVLSGLWSASGSPAAWRLREEARKFNRFIALTRAGDADLTKKENFRRILEG
jgi:hypothetical protein